MSPTSQVEAKHETGATPSTAPPPRFLLKRMLKYTNVAALVALAGVASLLSTHFLSISNIFNIFRQVSVLGIVSIGMTWVILNRGIDLSVGSVLALAGVTAGMVHNKGFFISLLAVLVVGGMCGTVNGLFVTKGKMQPFIATLVMFIVARGLALWVTDGRYIPNVKSWLWISEGEILSIPVPMILMILFFLLFNFLLNRTVWGRQVVAVGGNEDAARLSGISINWIKLSVYILTGCLVGVASLVYDARLWSADPLAGNMLELDAISAVLIGGTTFDGGKGTLSGTFIGVLIIQTMSNILNLLGVSVYSQMFAKGIIIAAAVLVGNIEAQSDSSAS